MSTILESIATLFDADARRRRQLADLVETRAALQAAFDQAINSGADSDKAFAKLDKCDAEIRAARAAIDATTAAAARQKQAQAAESREHLEQLAVVAFADYAREAVVFDELVNGGEQPPVGLTVVDQWGTVLAAFEVAHAAENRAITAGSARRTITTRGVLPTTVWTRAWQRLLRTTHKAGRGVLNFPSTPCRSDAESVAAVLQRELDSLPTFTKELSE